MNPYVGITGFMRKREVVSALTALPQKSARKLKVGVLCDSQTLEGRENISSNRYPRPENLRNIFQSHPKVLNLIHFRSEEQKPEVLYDQLVKARELAGPYCHGFQLNIPLPDPKLLIKFAAQTTKTVIGLQVWTQTFNILDNSSKALAEKIAQYEHLIDYAILDPNHDFDRQFDAAVLASHLRTILKKKLHIGLGVSGILSPLTMSLIEPLAREFPNLTVDETESLRNREDNLDLYSVKTYLQKAVDLFE